MTNTIETDNQIHLQRFKNEPPHASYIAGFIDGDGCIFIRKITDGYQSGIQFSQSRTNILQVFLYHFSLMMLCLMLNNLPFYFFYRNHCFPI